MLIFRGLKFYDLANFASYQQSVPVSEKEQFFLEFFEWRALIYRGYRDCGGDRGNRGLQVHIPYHPHRPYHPYFSLHYKSKAAEP